MSRIRSRHAQQGFTLLEAMVALTIAALTIIPLYEWVSRSLIALTRVSDVTHEAEVKLSAIAILSRVNPMEQADGTTDLGAYRLRWRSEPLVDPVDNAAYPRGIGLFQVALYTLHAEVQRSGTRWFEFDVQQIGYKRVRTPQVFQAPPPQPPPRP